jgi:hypothetical protein
MNPTRKDSAMNSKITKIIVKYPADQIPNVINPEKYAPHRFLIGKNGDRPLVAFCMNPSAAKDDTSDRTVNQVIRASEKLKYDGWFVVNIYPERATNAAKLGKFDEKLAKENVSVIEKFLLSKNIKEVWGAWGDLKYDPLRKGKIMVLEMLKKHNIKIFHFGDTTKSGDPRHPLCLKVTKENKRNYAIH